MVNEAKRPDYSHGTIFNQEAHLRRISTRESKTAEERPRRSRMPPPSSISPVVAQAPHRRRRPAAAHAPAPAGHGHDEQLYDVAEIMSQRQRNRKQNFLVRWEGYPNKTDWTWEPLRHIKHTPAFAEWRKKQYTARISKPLID